MPLILGSQSATAAGVYNIDNSCMFDRASADKMARTFGSGGDLRKWTLSFWMKRATNLTDVQRVFVAGNGSGGEVTLFGFPALQKMDFLNYRASQSPPSQGNLVTNRRFRDPSAWYHFVYVWDSDNSDADLRLREYVNGIELTSFSTDQNILNADSIMNTAVEHQIAKGWDTNYFSGYFAEMIFCNGQAYAASDFGEFDTDSPTMWKPKDPSGLTMTATSFWLDFKDSADLGNDVSGNGNDWTVTNIAATNQMTDTPTNNFPILNPLYNNQCTYSEGSLNCTISASSFESGVATFGAANGKWYCEFKCTAAASSGLTRNSLGIVGDVDCTNAEEMAAGEIGYSPYSIGWAGTSGTGAVHKDSSAQSGTFDVYGVGDICGVAMDLTNGKLYFSKNGTYVNSGDPTSGSTGTGAIDIDITGDAGFYLFANTVYSNAAFSANFGNPSYANTSDAADENGYGQFEYAPPTGYYAMCTKNLAEFG